MKFVILFIVIFLVVMYILIYAKRNKNHGEKDFSSVESFRNNYIDRRVEMQKRRDITKKTSNYVTKYNSTEDYRDCNPK